MRAAMRRAREELQRALRRLGEPMPGEPAGVGADGSKGSEAPQEAVEGEFREV